MELLTDKSEYKWIDYYSDGWNNNVKTHRLRECVPKNFPAYCKVLHKMFEDPNYNDLKLTYQHANRRKKTIIAARNIRKIFKRLLGKADKMTILDWLGQDEQAFGLELNRNTRVKWKDIAERLDIDYNADIKESELLSAFKKHMGEPSFPIYIYGPDEGTMDQEDVDNLLPLLKSHSKTDDCFFFFTLLIDPTEDDKLYKGKLDEIFNAYKQNDEFTPTYWWSAKREWLVWTDYDLSYTIVCGTEELINDLLQNDYFESFKVDLELEI